MDIYYYSLNAEWEGVINEQYNYSVCLCVYALSKQPITVDNMI